MMKPAVIPVRNGGETAYQITITDDFSLLPKALSSLKTEERTVCVVTDSNVEKLYAAQVTEALQGVCKRVLLYVLSAGEEHKNLDAVTGIYRFLIENHLDRKDVLIALGGGVTGDITGYAAATYLRGIRFVQVPTTLLAMVDSSIGGKTGVDFALYKNMVGAFHMPSAVYINLQTLRTLPDEQFACGMGEVLKHGLIRDADYYEWTISHMDEIEERDSETLRRLVEGSCLIKRGVVERDPLEQGERAILNFGHTIGHAIEKLKNFTLPHGQCVSLGCGATAYISMQRGMIDEDDFYEVRDMSVGFHLPITFDHLRAEDILEAVRHDKKMDAGQIRFILLEKIGKAVIDTTVTEQEIKEAVAVIDGEQISFA